MRVSLIENDVLILRRSEWFVGSWRHHRLKGSLHDWRQNPPAHLLLL